jgi:hypothetical protein
MALRQSLGLCRWDEKASLCGVPWVPIYTTDSSPTTTAPDHTEGWGYGLPPRARRQPPGGAARAFGGTMSSGGLLHEYELAA